MIINSTKKTDALITDIFRNLAKLHAQKNRAMGTSFDKMADTYFESPDNGKATYFRAYSFKTKNELKDHFTEIFENKLNPIPDDLLNKLTDLSFLLKENNTEQDADLSSLIYTLY